MSPLDRELRGAIVRAEADALVALLTEQDGPGEWLQMVGEAVLVLVHAHRKDVEPVARRCVDELRHRDWGGDAELADQIEAALGWAPTPLLRPLPVDLEELAGVLEGDPLNGGGRIDLQTGDVWPQDALDYGDIGEDEEAEDEEDERAGCGSRPRAPTRDTATWSGSSTSWRTTGCGNT